MPKRPSRRRPSGKTATRRGRGNGAAPSDAKTYLHLGATSLLRPDIGVQHQFRKKRAPNKYRYDASLSPALEWDEQPAREQGEALIRRVVEAGSLEEAKAAAAELEALSRPFLNWTGKAERQAFEVPTLPLFVHERLSTKAILENVQAHARDKQVMLDLFGDPHRPIADQVLRAYEHRDRWVNRMILGDSLVVMNSLLEYEGLGGQVQMIYIDPPYGVKFGSNFQPFVRKRDVRHGDDEDFTREPEMVQAYRDTWELGLHSFLSCLRDRIRCARDLLSPSGSLFVQISDSNLHHVRELLDETFGAENFCAALVMQKTSGLSSPTARVNVISTICDYVLWYARDRSQVKYRQLYRPKTIGPEDTALLWVELRGERRRLTPEERASPGLVPAGARLFRLDPIISQGYSQTLSQPFEWNGKIYKLSGNHHWKTTSEGMKRLGQLSRLVDSAGTIRYVRYIDDFPVSPLQNVWEDTGTGQFTEERLYVVQTPVKAVARCVLMTTDPGDLVLDPTCGSGTTAYVAEQWGRRWITIDVSRVPLALARQRLLTATYPWYELQDETRGPAGGFVYRRRQNGKGEEVGGIVPHVTLKSIANDEPPSEEVLVDRPEEVRGITRVAGPFTVEATIPVPVDFDADGIEDSGSEEAEGHGDFVDRMVEVLRRSPDVRLPGNASVRLEQVRRPAKTLSLSAEATVGSRPVAIVFGPEHGAVSEKLVFNAGSEATAKRFTHLYAIGFAIEPNARQLVEQAEAAMGVPATYVQATPDLVLGDLLKTMRSSQVFSVCGLPEISVDKVKTQRGEPQRWQVTLLGMDTFDPATMEATHRPGADVPAWFLDTDYNANRCFRVCQAFFPKTGAWDNLKRALRAEYDESLWDHLSGTTSAPFEAGEQRQVAVKVVDERGNELLVVRPLPA
jgi:adenine-specific DNA-methyltransferase